MHVSCHSSAGVLHHSPLLASSHHHVIQRFYSFHAAALQTVGPLAVLGALVAVPLDAQECLGLHRAHATTQLELTGQLQEPGVRGLGLGASRGRWFGLAEAATDPVTGGDLLSLNRASLTGGLQKSRGQATFCLGATTRRDELEESPSIRTTAIGAIAALGYRPLGADVPFVVFGQAQLESQREEITTVSGTARTATGSGIRLGAAYRLGADDRFGLRTFMDVNDAGRSLGASVSMLLRRPVRPPADSDADGVPDAADSCPDTTAGVRVNANGCEVDSDGDGVPDSKDKCPDTPAGARVNADGCEVDSDGDGVPDSRDACPNTPAGARVNANGCEVDSDADGVPDSRDRCPNTPAGAAVNADGCEIDSDGDGVPDSRDKCPGTTAGAAVDADGCPPIFDQGPIRLDGVNFATGTATLTAASLAKLDELADALARRETLRIEIGGHTDNTGRAALNDQLSLARANAVRDYLISRGIAADRLTARGYGSSEPVASNATAAGRAQNRRVEAKRID